MKKKTGFFREKICVTVSSRECTHRAPVRLTIHRGLMITLALVLVAIVAVSVYLTTDSLLKSKALTSAADSLNTKLEQQSGQINQYEQQIGELETDQE